MDNSELFNDKVLKACTRAANKVAEVNRRYTDSSEVLSELYQWVIDNRKYVEEWLELGQHGLNKLNVSLFRAGHSFVAVERARITKTMMSDHYWYTPAVIMELLPDVWDYQDWHRAPQHEHVKGKQPPSEGGNRQAMLIDVSYAVGKLAQDERVFLRQLFSHDAVDRGKLAVALGISDEALRKRAERMVAKLVDRLGGEPPFWPAGRRVKTNAAARAELRQTEQPMSPM